MARRRFFRPQDSYQTGPRVNERIRISPVLLIDENNENVGVIETREALRRAQEAGLDLVEVAASSRPPVCRIMDFGKYKYEQAKKDKASKAKSKSADLKEVRLGRSLKIDPHDIEIRVQQARRFLIDGHKVQIVQNFMGRENMHRDKGYERMRDIADRLGEVSKVEMPPRVAGRRMSMILAPDRAKVQQALRKETAASQRPPQDRSDSAPVQPPPTDAPLQAENESPSDRETVNAGAERG